jgi:hypothetical protein
VIDDEHDARAHDCDEHRVDIEAGDSRTTYIGEDEAADARAHDPENDVQDAALAALVDHTACDKAGDQAENNPTGKSHVQPPFIPQRRESAMVQFKIRLNGNCPGILATEPLSSELF